MIHIRGENVYPTEIENVLRGLEHYGGEHRIIVTRTGSMDELHVDAECVHTANDPTALEVVQEDRRHRTAVHAGPAGLGRHGSAAHL